MSKRQSGRQITSIWSLNCIKLQHFQHTLHSPFALYFQGPTPINFQQHLKGDESYQLDQPTLHSPLVLQIANQLPVSQIVNTKHKSTQTGCIGQPLIGKVWKFWKGMPVATICRCILCTNTIQLYFLFTGKYSTKYPTLHHTVLRQVTWFVE